MSFTNMCSSSQQNYNINRYLTTSGDNMNYNSNIWSYTDGGPVGAPIPTRDDNVFIHCVSNTDLILSRTEYCKNLTITIEAYTLRIITNQYHLAVYGNYEVITPGVPSTQYLEFSNAVDSIPSLVFVSVAGKNNTLKETNCTPSYFFLIYDHDHVRFSGKGSFTLLSDMYIGQPLSSPSYAVDAETTLNLNGFNIFDHQN